MVASRGVILAAAVCALDAAAAFAPPTLPTSVRAQSQRAPSALALRARGADEDAAPAAGVPRRVAALRIAVMAGVPMLLMPHQAAVAETEMKEQKKSKKQMDEEYEEDLSGQRKVGRAARGRRRHANPVCGTARRRSRRSRTGATRLTVRVVCRCATGGSRQGSTSSGACQRSQRSSPCSMQCRLALKPMTWTP